MIAIQHGSVGPEVEDVQRRLSALGHPSEPDDLGWFDEGTLAAVRAFQQQRGLPATGELDRTTRSRLLADAWPRRRT